MTYIEEEVNTLLAWGLSPGQDVEVELTVTTCSDGQRHHPVLVEGVIVAATGNVLVLKGNPTDVRIAWQAIATIRNRITHPAL